MDLHFIHSVFRTIVTHFAQFPIGCLNYHRIKAPKVQNFAIGEV